MLRSDVPRDRLRALAYLRRTGGEHALSLLAQALHDPDVDVLFTAAGSLAGTGAPQAVEALVALAIDDRRAIVRRVVAVEALGHIRGLPEHAVLALRLLSKAGDRWLRGAAREALMQRARW